MFLILITEGKRTPFGGATRSVKSCIVGRVSNLDYLQKPKIKNNKAKPNYIQWITMDDGQLTRDPIDELLYILFFKKEYLYGELYDNSKLTKYKIRTHLKRVACVHRLRSPSVVLSKNIYHGFLRDYG